MKPFLTLLLESYRGLKSETIFWVTVGLSVIVATLFLSIGLMRKRLAFYLARQILSPISVGAEQD